MKILGISAYYHDSAAALLVDGQVVAACQEERFTRRKFDESFPVNAVRYCLEQGGGAGTAVDYAVFYEKPFPKFERLLETYLAFAPRGFTSFRTAVPLWLKEKLFQKDQLLKQLRTLLPGFAPEQLLFSEHHLSHAASAFFASPFERAAILTLDGVGEWATGMCGVGREHHVETRKEMRFPHSLGLLYSAFTSYMGFKVNSGEYKLMGLAPYGRPLYVDKIRDHLIDIKPDGSFRLDLDYFDYCTGLRMTSERFHELFAGRPLGLGDELTQYHMDLAASIQAVTEDVVLRLGRSLAAETGESNLCLGGGVALNCVANGKLLRDGCFKNLWVQPAAGDAGSALGAALFAHYTLSGGPRRVAGGDSMMGGYLGPEYSQAEIESTLTRQGARYVVHDQAALLRNVVALLDGGKVVGWFQGRMEFGPRALGNRSILGDPRAPHMQTTLNLKVKFRESFRPFAPAVLREDLEEWFELQTDSPYMLLVGQVDESQLLDLSAAAAVEGFERLKVPRSTIPAVTHVDNSARVQTVHRETNPRFHALLTAFKEQTGCPVLINTSFNVRGEPIICSPIDAWECFMGTAIDALAIGNCLLLKEEQDPALLTGEMRQFEHD